MSTFVKYQYLLTLSAPPRSDTFDVLIIGAGAAGLMAAGRAAALGARVLLLEKMERAGRKLLITGKGRCNITNDAPLEEFYEHIFPHGRFLKHAFNAFPPAQLVSLLNQLGLDTVVERGGRVFPASGKAADVVNALMKWVEQGGVKAEYGWRAEELLIKDQQVQGIQIRSRDTTRVLAAKKIILCVGGQSYPGTGSTGDGYAIALGAGHRIITPHPALVPLVTEGDTAGKMKGLLLKNVNASLWVNGKKVKDEFGEMSFADFGLDGPIILTLSRQAVDALRAKNKVEISIDLKPALDHEKLDMRLRRDLDTDGKARIYFLLKGLLPMQMIPVFLEKTALDVDKACHQLSGKERKSILHLLKDFRFQVSGFRSFNEAIVTAGGISTEEVSSKTMESKLVKGLYFAGEILDLDANTGGFNLQIAFSTGWLAGTAAAGD
ncbi:MAG: NAD(P)/FAD-dependent oxidoreductase [Bacteroidales bacterium]